MTLELSLLLRLEEICIFVEVYSVEKFEVTANTTKNVHLSRTSVKKFPFYYEGFYLSDNSRLLLCKYFRFFQINEFLSLLIRTESRLSVDAPLTF